MAVAFGANHIVARIAFDAGAGVALAALLRSSVCVVVLAGVLLYQRRQPQVPPATQTWALLAGLLVAVQSLCVFSAVARAPVALALLVFNLFPVLFMLLSWRTGGARPQARAFGLIALILVGLVLVLDVPRALLGVPWTARFVVGIVFALCAACAFAGVLWITDRKLAALLGVTRTFWLQGTVAVALLALAALPIVPAQMWSAPCVSRGWWALAVVAVVYGLTFSALFVLMPRLDMRRNAPAANIEPVATLFMGWWILGQSLIGVQWLGAAIVCAGIIGLGVLKN